MKTLITLASIILLCGSAAFAQSAGPGASYNSSVGTSARGSGQDITGFHAKTRPGVTMREANLPPNPNVILKPKLGGVFMDGGKYGTIMISPTAPAEYGMGEAYLAAPNARYDLDHMSGPSAHHDAGGIKLFSLEF